jgi:hypothetical protein
VPKWFDQSRGEREGFQYIRTDLFLELSAGLGLPPAAMDEKMKEADIKAGKLYVVKANLIYPSIPVQSEHLGRGQPLVN